MNIDDLMIHGPHKDPYHPYDPQEEAERRADWEKHLATCHSPRAPQTGRWNGVR